MVAAVLGAILMLGCSSPEKRYQVLSFFFDGVPDPNAPVHVIGSKVGDSTGNRTVVHKPYADNQCNSCHLNTNDIFARAQVREDLCVSCHAGTPVQYAVMHGPVVNNACQMCHVPHSSALPHLLRQPSPGLCTQCHEPGGLALMHKQPLDPKASCIDCHSGHGGSDHTMLLALAPQLPRTAEEASTPAIAPGAPSPTPSPTPPESAVPR
jgi:predicted CXXCH cytochrome family protein